jgi:hypothetical protein
MASSQALEAKTIPEVTVVSEVLVRGNKYAHCIYQYHPQHRYTVMMEASYPDHETTVTAPTITTSHKREQNEVGVWINIITVEVDPFEEAEPEILRESPFPAILRVSGVNPSDTS